jgi:hypothetical protein
MDEASARALADMLCRQQRAAWLGERYDAENELGTELLNAAFLRYGLVGIDLVVSGPDGVEWADHRGLFALAGQPPVPASAPEAAALGAGRVGWGQVSLAEPDPTGAAAPDVAGLRWAIEWRSELKRREATAVVRAILLADGAPDAAFVRRAVGAPAPAPTIPVILP